MRTWKRFEKLPRRYLRAYKHNTAAAPDFSENLMPNGALIFQSGGVFPKLRFRRARMSNVCCEILAAFNALTLTKTSVDFLKLAAEFEYGAAIPAIPPGVFGCDPFRIGRCFEAYGVSFAKYRSPNELEKALTVGKISVVSYKFGRLDPRIHTFAVEKTADGVAAYNRYSNVREPELLHSVRDTLSREKVFLAGYVLR